MSDKQAEPGQEHCKSCLGSGEVGSEFGPTRCPDCGGAGYLPSPHVLVEWRSRDIERAHAGTSGSTGGDIRWLLAELRRSRDALMEISALAQELDENPISARIRFTANAALRLYEVRAEKP
ncbi:MAG TPA: hypothetical protein VGQ57_16120 [Polyangiaceae bacterium]|jgi:hypothetical protein|nr:hypothetical protein [Polyangiaceae bacterium]